MNTQSIIQNFRNRVLAPPRIQFPCPVCERDIEIKKIDTGADLICPHCTAWIAAPIPDLNLGAQIRDQSVVQIQQFQEAHGRKLVDLKRGRFEASVLRKQKRIEDKNAAAQEPAAGAQSLPPPEALHAPAAAVILDEPFSTAYLDPPIASTAPGAAAGRLPAARRPLAQNGARGFQPRDGLPVALNDNTADVLTWEEEPGIDARSAGSFLSGKGKVASLACGAAILVTLLVFVKSELSEKRQHLLQEQIRKQEHLEKSLATQLEDARKTQAVSFARKALAAPTWNELLPFVRHPNRVRPIMEEYYANHAWRPITVSEFVGGEFEDFQGHDFFAFGAKDAAGESFVVGMEKTPDGWKIDWEVLVPLAQMDWQRFVEERPLESRTLRVSAIRRTPTDEMQLLTGVPEGDAFGIMLWCTDISEGSLYAVLHKDSALAEELAEFLSVSHGTKLIVDMAFLPVGDGMRNDMVTITRIATKGWTILDESPPEEPRREKSDAIRNAVGLPVAPHYAWNAGASGWERSTWKDPRRGR